MFTNKKYVMIVTSEDERYGTEVQLDFFTDNPHEGLLMEVVYGNNRDELFIGEYEGLFYQLYATDTGKKIGYGMLELNSLTDEIAEYEHQRNKEVTDVKTWNVSCVRSGHATVEARTEKEAWQEANKLGVNDVYWDNNDWTPTSVNVVNRSEF